MLSHRMNCDRLLGQLGPRSRTGKSKQRSVIRDSDSQENIANKCIQIEGYLATEEKMSG